MAEISAGEHSVDRTMHDLRMLYGGDQEKADPSKWVFVPEGVKSNQGANFFDEYSDAIRGLRKQMPNLPGSRLYFDTNFEDEPRNGKDAERLFFDYFNTVADYFSHPANVGKLGLITRQFLSHYVDEDLLKDVEPKICQKLEEVEDDLVIACPGNRAAMSDLLRLLYNRAVSNVLTDDDAVEIRAGKFGTQGRSLTLIDMPADLIAKRRLDEMKMARSGKVYCLGDEDGEVYQRGAWSALEWGDAKERIGAEAGVSTLTKAARLKAVDPFFFPEKVAHSVGSCYNLLKALRNTVISQCKERREFSIVRFASVLKEKRADKDGPTTRSGRDQSEHGTPPDYDYDSGPGPNSSEYGDEMGGHGENSGGRELLPDEEELDAPPIKALPGGGNGPSAMGGGADAKETSKKNTQSGKSPPATAAATAGAGESSVKRADKPTKTPAQKAASLFAKKWGIRGGAESSELESIFSRKEGFSPSDYAPEIGAFCKTEVLAKGAVVKQWIDQGQRARGIDEARVLAGRSLPPKGPGKVALVVEKDGGETVVLLAKRGETSGSVLFKEVAQQDVSCRGKIRNGRLFLDGDEGGFRPLAGITRVPYRVPGEDISRDDRKDKVLRKGGILAFFRKFGRGDNIK